MRALILSLLLPFGSHFFRQSVACSDLASPDVFSLFMIAYSLSMLLHSTWIECESRSDAKTHVLRLCILLLPISFFVSLHFSNFFLLGWSIHSLFSSVMWPLGYRLVNSKKRSKTFLVAWSLQGNLGDLCGCYYHPGRNPLFHPVAWCVMGVCLLSAGLLPSSTAVSQTLSNPFLPEAGQSNPSLFLAVAVLANSCLKTITYTASNFIPRLGIRYVQYGCGGVVGTLVSGLVVDATRGSTVPVFAASLLVSGWMGVQVLHPNAWGEDWFVIGFGAMASLASSLVSICLCTEISEMSRAFGKTTALLDGFATLPPALLQALVGNEADFSVLQACSSVGFLISATLLCFLNVRRTPPSRPLPF